MMQTIVGLPFIFLAVMGLLFFLPPLLVIFFKMKFRIACLKAMGKVIRIERNYDPESESTAINPVIEFTNQNGETVEVKTGISYGLRYMPRLHQSVKLYYRPNTQPLKFQVASKGLWQVSAILMLTGLTLMLPAILHFLLSY